MKDKDQQLIFEAYTLQNEKASKYILGALACALIGSGCTDEQWDKEADAFADAWKKTPIHTMSIDEQYPANSPIWQENGGKYNRLAWEIIRDGVGHPSRVYNPDDPTGTGYIKRVHEFWKTKGEAIMLRHLEEGHPSAKLWHDSGRKFNIAELN